MIYCHQKVGQLKLRPSHGDSASEVTTIWRCTNVYIIIIIIIIGSDSYVAVCPSICWSRQILLQLYLMNSLSNLYETYREYSLAHTDDLIRF